MPRSPKANRVWGRVRQNPSMKPFPRRPSSERPAHVPNTLHRHLSLRDRRLSGSRGEMLSIHHEERLLLQGNPRSRNDLSLAIAISDGVGPRPPARAFAPSPGYLPPRKGLSHLREVAEHCHGSPWSCGTVLVNRTMMLAKTLASYRTY